jgi:hypothetical protein
VRRKLHTELPERVREARAGSWDDSFVVKNGCATAQDDCRRCDVCSFELPPVRRAGEHPGADPGLDCGYPSASQPVADTGDRTSATTGAISVA